MMATDRTLVDAAIREAAGRACPPPTAIARAVEPHARALDSLDDPMLAARAADLRAVGRRAADLALGLAEEPPAGAIVVADDLGPGEVASWAGRIAAIVLAGGGTTAHAAIVARSLHVPLVTAAGEQVLAIPVGEPVGIDADRGSSGAGPTRDVRARLAARIAAIRLQVAADQAERHQPAVDHRRPRPAPAGERRHGGRGDRRARGRRRRHRPAAQRAGVPRGAALADRAGPRAGAGAAAASAREPHRDRADTRFRRRQDAAVPGRAGRRRPARRTRHPPRAGRRRRHRAAAARAPARRRRRGAAHPGPDGHRDGRGRRRAAGRAPRPRRRRARRARPAGRRDDRGARRGAERARDREGVRLPLDRDERPRAVHPCRRPSGPGRRRARGRAPPGCDPADRTRRLGGARSGHPGRRLRRGGRRRRNCSPCSSASVSTS